ncbi:tRNA -methyltransferase TrmI [Golovinomyces cichoracearum]|uniref:tRNA (adenine(58)-N(1))-methyltransferase catalytic subunit TRM61 n=1 Tax=Golovinomyces cichoracearum TaxID=62708 RepID=A0A420J137_9PEZI|nr:tRNA -methyltransferase TrmI [Golovinomyces cichoracearum]
MPPRFIIVDYIRVDQYLVLISLALRSLSPLTDFPTAENDIVILKSSVNDRAEPILTKPLKSGNYVSYKKLKQIIKHDAIIGKYVRDYVRATNGVDYRIYRPTIGEYTDNTPRLVTPIYSQDANLIVSLLDLHPELPGSQTDKLEIFEAGTGHGALTLFLARAIHAANTLPPDIPSDILSQSPAQSCVKEKYDEWRAQRRAIIYSLDNQEKHTRHAAANIKRYRGGIYFPHIDFHTGLIEDVIPEKLALNSNAPFLQHSILDLPSPQNYMKLMAEAVRENGLLLVFVPSVTQITKASLLAINDGLPWVLENVLELGGMIGTGGREWDVRPVQPRAFQRAALVEETSSTDDLNVVEPVTDSETLSDDHSMTELKGWEMVCRPKVGVRITNGGFIGVWRKTCKAHRNEQCYV